MAHRGPDDAGLTRFDQAVLAHRRLSVIDPSSNGRQPMTSADGRFTLVYNGMLYNDLDVRRELSARGFPRDGFRTACDTETVLAAFECWATDALTHLRGMFALALWDERERLLTLARDPLGVKPLYFWAGSKELLFASEPGPIVRSPLVGAAPNLAMVSAYLTTIRTVLGNDTLFQGVHAVAPGQLAQCSFNGPSPVIRLVDWFTPGESEAGEAAEEEVFERVREGVTESTLLHLRSDVPTCSLLSGGLDSTIVASLAKERLPSLRTFCAGSACDGDDNDLSCARRASAALGTRHSEALIDEERFARDWAWMVETLGAPLSTPNEVAIHAVARRLRDDGCVVTVSGEGADELFAGYGPPMVAAAQFIERGVGSGGRFQLESNAWIPTQAKAAILREEVWSTLDADAGLRSMYEQTFERCAREAGEDADPLEAHLRFHQRVNLAGLLQRLDTATMLTGVEGRTPYADAVVAGIAARTPMRCKFMAAAPAGVGGRVEAGGETVQTKIALRRAFADRVPSFVVDRAKASFPLPFERWLHRASDRLRASQFARAIFTEAAVETIAAAPNQHWRLAWPMINLALWGDRWWGRGAAR
jgi:asparagine synthase (glutamine-hydrolysing)